MLSNVFKWNINVKCAFLFSKYNKYNFALWFKWVSIQLNCTHNNEGLYKWSDFTVLTQSRTYLTNSTARNKQSNLRKPCVYTVCVHVPACVCASNLACLCVFVCSGKSGVWILSSCLSDRKASSVKQRGHSISQCYASFRLLCIFPPHTLAMQAHTQTTFAGLHTIYMKQKPVLHFKQNHIGLCCSTLNKLLSVD